MGTRETMRGKEQKDTKRRWEGGMEVNRGRKDLKRRGRKWGSEGMEEGIYTLETDNKKERGTKEDDEGVGWRTMRKER